MERSGSLHSSRSSVGLAQDPVHDYQLSVLRDEDPKWAPSDEQALSRGLHPAEWEEYCFQEARAWVDELPKTVQRLFYDVFHRVVGASVHALLTEDNQGQPTQKVWMVLMGVGNHFVCHLACGLETVHARNPIETDKVDPMLVYGEMVDIDTSIVQEIQDQLSRRCPHHFNLPTQMAFGIEHTGSNSSQRTSQTAREALLQLIHGGQEVPLKDCKIFPLNPAGGNSLSWRGGRGFPITFWSHGARREALTGALKVACQRAQSSGNSSDKDRAELAVLQEIEKLEDQVERLKDLIVMEQDDQELQQQVKALIAVEGEIEAICKEHESLLPNSYLRPTFQIEASFRDAQRGWVYKRFSAQGSVREGIPAGSILTGRGATPGAARSNLNHLDAVHNPYDDSLSALVQLCNDESNNSTC